ncbi:DNA cytosine methyltransferase [Streptomyces sp. NPDC001858]
MNGFLDLFAGGAGGWHYGLAAHGLTSRGLEFDRWAVASRRAAGHDVLLCDVTTADPLEHAVDGLAASPPCRPFSPGGKREGLGDRDVVAEAIDDLAAGRDSRDRLLARCVNPDSLLAAEPMRWIRALLPRTVVMEQVQAVLPLWQPASAKPSARSTTAATSTACSPPSTSAGALARTTRRPGRRGGHRSPPSPPPRLPDPHRRLASLVRAAGHRNSPIDLNGRP